MILMITDGLTQEAAVTDWVQVTRDSNINLSLLLIKDPFRVAIPNLATYGIKQDLPSNKVCISFYLCSLMPTIW